MGEGGLRDGVNGQRVPSLLDALVPVVALVGLLAVSYILFGGDAASGPNQVALLFCGIIAAGIARKNGMPWSGVQQAVASGISMGLPAILILLAVGALIGTWSLCGTIVAMIYYGLKILSPDYFYATTALVCAIVGFSIGSSWTVAGTVGIGLIGIAATMNLSPVITAGAIISGAYFGDKASPLAGSVNLVTAAAGSEIFEHIRESLWTSLPALLIAIGIFFLLRTPGEFDASPALSRLEGAFAITPWAFLPLLVVLALSLARMPPFVTIFAGALCGGILAVVHDPARVLAFAASPELPASLSLLKGVWSTLASGYSVETGDAPLDAIVTRGGMVSMMTTVWLIIAAMSFGAIVEQAGFLQRLIDPIVARAKSVGAMFAAVVATCLAANVLTCDQYIAIVLPGRLFGQTFAKRGLKPVMLSRVVGDSATVTSPLVPWNSCGAYMTATLGIPTTAYAAFSYFNMINPVMTILFGLLGLRVLRQPQPSEPEAESRTTTPTAP